MGKSCSQALPWPVCFVHLELTGFIVSLSLLSGVPYTLAKLAIAIATVSFTLATSPWTEQTFFLPLFPFLTSTFDG